MPSISLPTGRYELRVGVVTTRGNVREHNEDNYYVPGRPSIRNNPILRNGNGSGSGGGRGSLNTTEEYVQTVPDVPGLFIVADGMGGQLAGERASQLAVELIPGELSRRLGESDDEKSIQRAIREAIARTNEEILAQSHLQPDYANMGTTVVLALFRRGRAFITGIGDSRAYHLHHGRIEQLTRDHS